MPNTSFYKLVLAAGLLSTAFAVSGCGGSITEDGGTRQVRLATDTTDDASLTDIVEAESMAPGFPPSGPINVYFHVIKQGISVADGDIPQQWIDDQMDVLNGAFAPHGYTFNLVSVDQMTNASWFDMTKNSPEEAACKATMRIGTARDLNIYTARMGATTRGWATFPKKYDTAPTNDGVVLYFDTLPGGSAPGFNLGDTATHEVGHWLGLYNTYHFGCDEKESDKVLDTEREKKPADGCPVARDSCKLMGGKDPVTNFMDASDDTCTTNFTLGQKKRMDKQWTRWREGQ